VFRGVKIGTNYLGEYYLKSVKYCIKKPLTEWPKVIF